MSLLTLQVPVSIIRKTNPVEKFRKGKCKINKYTIFLRARRINMICTLMVMSSLSLNNLLLLYAQLLDVLRTIEQFPFYLTFSSLLQLALQFLHYTTFHHLFSFFQNILIWIMINFSYFLKESPDFTIEGHRMDRQRKKVESGKKRRCICRLCGILVFLVAFMGVLVALSMVYTRGQRYFGSV